MKNFNQELVGQADGELSYIPPGEEQRLDGVRVDSEDQIAPVEGDGSSIIHLGQADTIFNSVPPERRDNNSLQELPHQPPSTPVFELKNFSHLVSPSKDSLSLRSDLDKSIFQTQT